jgi:hypothetical protein
VTRSSTPSNESPLPKRPCVVHVAPEMVAVRLLPDASAVVVPVPSLNPDAARRLLSTLKVAAADRAALSVTVHVVPATVSHPVQPPETDPVAGAAVRVTTVPSS